MVEVIQFLINQYSSKVKYLEIEIRYHTANQAATMIGLRAAYIAIIKDLKTLIPLIKENYVEKEFVEKLLKEFAASDSIEYWYKHYKDGNL